MKYLRWITGDHTFKVRCPVFLRRVLLHIHLPLNNSDEVWKEAFDCIGWCDEGTETIILQHALVHETAAIRLKAANRCAARTSPRLLPLLRDMLNDSDLHCRSAAAIVLVRYGEPTACDTILALARRGNIPAPADANAFYSSLPGYIVAIGKSPADCLQPIDRFWLFLPNCLSPELEIRSRLAGIEAVRKLGVVTCVLPIARCSVGKSPMEWHEEREFKHLREAAIEALKSMGQPAIDSLLSSLKRDDGNDALVAASALRQMGCLVPAPLVDEARARQAEALVERRSEEKARTEEAARAVEPLHAIYVAFQLLSAFANNEYYFDVCIPAHVSPQTSIEALLPRDGGSGRRRVQPTSLKCGSRFGTSFIHATLVAAAYMDCLDPLLDAFVRKSSDPSINTLLDHYDKQPHSDERSMLRARNYLKEDIARLRERLCEYMGKD